MKSSIGLLLAVGLGSSVAYSNHTDFLKRSFCKKEYSLDCFKLDLLEVVEKTSESSELQLLPGIFLSHRVDKENEKNQSLLTNTTDLQEYLGHRVNAYLESITLSVKLLDTKTLTSARKLGQRILMGFLPAETGRKKGYGGALWAAGTLAAVGVASLAAVSGKALMTSMLALMLAGAGAMRGGGGGGGAAGGGGCKGAAYIDAHARNMEVEFQRPPLYHPPPHHQLLPDPQHLQLN